MERGRQWKKGETGNPRGRPKKGKSWVELIRRYGARKIVFEGKQVTRREAVVKMMYDEIIHKKDVDGAFKIVERLEGKPLQAIQQSGESKITVKIDWGDNTATDSKVENGDQPKPEDKPGVSGPVDRSKQV